MMQRAMPLHGMMQRVHALPLLVAIVRTKCTAVANILWVFPSHEAPDPDWWISSPSKTRHLVS